MPLLSPTALPCTHVGNSSHCRNGAVSMEPGEMMFARMQQAERISSPNQRIWGTFPKDTLIEFPALNG